MKEIIIATKNAGKAKEFEHIFKPYNVRVKSLLDFEEMDDIVEDGKTFEANALIKARAIANQFNQMVLADDSGLEVDALDGRPGVYSARYAGEGRNDEDNILKVLHELEGVPTDERGARFVCALAIVTPQGDEVVVRGTCEGRILTECLGTEGFGYDPIFYVDEYNCSTAQLSREKKNQLSHRGKALRAMREKLAER